MEHQYIAQNQGKYTVAALLAGFVLLTVLSNFLIPAPLARQVAVFVYVIAATYVTIRHVLTSFRYVLTEQNFSVTKLLSGYDTLLADIPAKELLSVSREKHTKGHVDNLTVNLFSSDTCIVTYREGKYIRNVKIECDEALFSKLLQMTEKQEDA